MSVLSVVRLYLNWYMYFVLEVFIFIYTNNVQKESRANVCVSIYVFVKINYNKT
jgi:hypothetical protein